VQNLTNNGSKRARARSRLSRRSFAANALSFELHALADNLGNFLAQAGMIL
jgi:hypothetical protein